MAGLVPAIDAFLAVRPLDVDARDERGHDGVRFRWNCSHTSIAVGLSIYCLIAPISSAPSAPSTAR
jgi:hypothetical protein